MTDRSSSAIEASGLTKSFRRNPAVNGIDLVVPTGSVYGLLGPNGAGKTTLIRMLATLLQPDAGRARVFGHDVVTEAAAVRSRISLTGQFSSVDDELTGLENLVILGRLLGYSAAQANRRADELLEAFGLGRARRRQVLSYSGGMRRRLDIAASIVVTPDLVFLDEPTTGLDPHSRNDVWQIVRELVAQGSTVLLTTQYLDEADQLADRIGVIDGGAMVAEGTSAELKRSVGAGSLRVRLDDVAHRALALRILSASLSSTATTGADPSEITAHVGTSEDALLALAALADAGIAVADFTLAGPSLDEVFLALTGRVVEEVLS